MNLYVNSSISKTLRILHNYFYEETRQIGKSHECRSEYPFFKSRIFSIRINISNKNLSYRQFCLTKLSGFCTVSWHDEFRRKMSKEYQLLVQELSRRLLKKSQYFCDGKTTFEFSRAAGTATKTNFLGSEVNYEEKK